MDTQSRLRLLHEVYRIHAGLIAAESLHCRRQCALCCTPHVTMTTLEGMYMIHGWETAGSTRWMDAVGKAAREPRFQPLTTINQFAGLCAADASIPDSGDPPVGGSCPFLKDDICAVYAFRPFGCRAMVSRTDCADLQAADMPAVVLTLNNVLMQYIEALDVNRLTGNMIDILLLMSDSRQRRCYDAGLPLHPTGRLLANRPISILMVPPEHREKTASLVQTLRQLQPREPECGGPSRPPNSAAPSISTPAWRDDGQ